MQSCLLPVECGAPPCAAFSLRPVFPLHRISPKGPVYPLPVLSFICPPYGGFFISGQMRSRQVFVALHFDQP